jgi:hypothetical protein
MTRVEPLILQISKYTFPVLTGIFVLLYFIRQEIYHLVIQEDHFVEWLTFFMLLASGLVSMLLALRIKHKYGYQHGFFIFFSGFSVLAGFEEISWGQRIFGWETRGIFAEYSDQQEINLHNTMQGIFAVKTKHIALFVLFCYGVILPWLAAQQKSNFRWIKKRQFIIPPNYLAPGFFIATLMMLDLPTGREEEIGEFFYSICFLLMTLHYYRLEKHGNIFQRPCQPT